jgi:hypothetical protein
VGFCIGLAILRGDLLDYSPGRKHRTHVLLIDVVKNLQVVDVVQINVCPYDVCQTHIGVFIIKKAPHGLAEFMWRGVRIASAVLERKMTG